MTKRENDKMNYIYILTNKYNTTLYIGVTSNIEKRLYEHRQKVIKSFTKKYNLYKLVYIEQCENINVAIEREKYLKGKKRQFKIDLINSQNPLWEDLAIKYGLVTDNL